MLVLGLPAGLGGLNSDCDAGSIICPFLWNPLFHEPCLLNLFCPVGFSSVCSTLMTDERVALPHVSYISISIIVSMLFFTTRARLFGSLGLPHKVVMSSSIQKRHSKLTKAACVAASHVAVCYIRRCLLVAGGIVSNGAIDVGFDN